MQVPACAKEAKNKQVVYVSVLISHFRLFIQFFHDYSAELVTETMKWINENNINFVMLVMFVSTTAEIQMQEKIRDQFIEQFKTSVTVFLQ